MKNPASDPQSEPNTPKKTNEEKQFPGYPLYPADEDIYTHNKKADGLNIDEADDSAPGMKPWERNEKDFNEDPTGEDLDIPGSELDDDMEEIGSEDEENNYYSLGGDDHNDLEEDGGDE